MSCRRGGVDHTGTAVHGEIIPAGLPPGLYVTFTDKNSLKSHPCQYFKAGGPACWVSGLLLDTSLAEVMS
jgi:hypothetical protein